MLSSLDYYYGYYGYYYYGYYGYYYYGYYHDYYYSGTLVEYFYHQTRYRLLPAEHHQEMWLVVR